MIRPPPTPPLFPSTPLFRSARQRPSLRRRRVGLALEHRDCPEALAVDDQRRLRVGRDRKSTRLNSSHLVISYAVFCLKKKKKLPRPTIYIVHASTKLYSSSS